MEAISILIKIMLFVIPLIVFIGMYKTQWNIVKQLSKEKSTNAVLNLLKEENAYEVSRYKKERKYFSVGYLDEYLSTKGGYYMFNWLNPATFLMVKFGLSILFLILGFLLANMGLYLSFPVSLLIGFVTAIAGFFVFDLVINISNESDNDEMVDDIHAIFNVLRMQARAGVFLSTSISECYLSVKQPRLKAALLEMSNKISLTNDLETAVYEFNRKFDNRYIDTLCITINQAQKSGKSVKLLEDLSKQIEDIQLAANIREKEKMDTKTQVFELIIYVDLLAIVLYALVIEMINTFSAF